ncbi:hypothetical protein L6303_04405 [archaeon]|nr:hypothetical protein [Nanoarchaeota archaeon]MBU4301038.1 hypothetical protein [Nanoarchaeota archaeon]MBU4451722.1 hypothetical protein [Nanoarchaeota archaeon]MCG2723960.1 hypothetical protein [archaeon]
MKSKMGFCYLTVFAVLAFLITAQAAIAATTNNTVTVNINISSVGAIVVLPNSLSWTTGELGSINPGADSAVSNLIIKNTGSVNVSSIYMNASTVGDEPSNPLQTADAAYYSAAGLVMVKNATDTSFYHAGRLEWNLSTVLTDETLNLAGTTGKFSHGWYRNASGNEYLWKLENGTNGFCNNTATTFAIKVIPENQTTMNRNLAAGLSACSAVTTGTDWGVFTCTDGPLADQCVAAASTCDKIYIYKYYATLADYPTCTNSDYLRRANIVPGDEAAFSVKASVPKGTPAGDAVTGTLTIIATY